MYNEGPSALLKQLAAALWKLENLVHVPGTTIDDFLQDLHFLLSTSSTLLYWRSLNTIFECHNLQVDDLVVTEIVRAAISTQFIKQLKRVAHLVLCINVKKRKNLTWFIQIHTHYITRRNTLSSMSHLKSLQNTLNCKVILDKVIDNHRGQRETELEPLFELRFPEDGVYFKSNAFLNSDKLRSSLHIYVDDFESCNRLGTSQNKSFLVFTGF